MPGTPPPVEVRRRAPGLYTVIAIKLGKALLLLGLAVGVYSLLGEDLNALLDRLLRLLRQDPADKFWVALGERLDDISPAHLRSLASGTFLYSVLLLAESYGLIRRAWWAVWLAIGETAFFIPLEVAGLLGHFRAGVLGLLLINVLIVWYLVAYRQRLFPPHHPKPA
jgi:uncharacterized membrane protein (DUF2068 family)